MIYTWERGPCQETHDLCPILIIADGAPVHYTESFCTWLNLFKGEKGKRCDSRCPPAGVDAVSRRPWVGGRSPAQRERRSTASEFLPTTSWPGQAAELRVPAVVRPALPARVHKGHPHLV